MALNLLKCLFVLITIGRFCESRYRGEPSINSIHSLYDGLNIYFQDVPASCNLKSIGIGDGEKRFCLSSVPSQDPRSIRYVSETNCVIVSIGSNNRYDFEESILKESACRVFTFDCTVDPIIPKELSATHRHFFYKICLGTEDKIDNDGKKYMTWLSMTKLMNASQPGIIVALKMDIEGWEFSVFESMQQEPHLVPRQIACELHGRTWSKYHAPYFQGGNKVQTIPNFKSKFLPAFMLSIQSHLHLHLADRNDNPKCPHCTEILLLHNSLYQKIRNTTNFCHHLNTSFSFVDKQIYKFSSHPFASMYDSEHVIALLVSAQSKLWLDTAFAQQIFSMLQEFHQRIIFRVFLYHDEYCSSTPMNSVDHEQKETIKEEEIFSRLVQIFGRERILFHVSSSLRDDLFLLSRAKRVIILKYDTMAQLVALLASSHLIINANLAARLNMKTLRAAKVEIMNDPKTNMMMVTPPPPTKHEKARNTMTASTLQELESLACKKYTISRAIDDYIRDAKTKLLELKSASSSIKSSIEKRKQIIIVDFSRGGLGNRLDKILYAALQAIYTGRILCVINTSELMIDNYYATPSFVLAWGYEYELCQKKFDSDDGAIIIDGHNWIPQSPISMPFLINLTNKVNAQYNQKNLQLSTADTIIGCISNTFLKPSSHIQLAMQPYFQNFSKADLVLGLHLRSGDMNMAKYQGAHRRQLHLLSQIPGCKSIIDTQNLIRRQLDICSTQYKNIILFIAADHQLDNTIWLQPNIFASNIHVITTPGHPFHTGRVSSKHTSEQLSGYFKAVLDNFLLSQTHILISNCAYQKCFQSKINVLSGNSKCTHTFVYNSYIRRIPALRNREFFLPSKNKSVSPCPF
uniref:Methyltransferase domain-containing protein n=1 Tax=Aureoumbra lagunensis TaxID=44058 RepID=A0A7S3JWW0_9STRA|mmetsp:Transcript_21823/g.33561  ORF Transcript_21823/g.33561 Transcript_21823/m.33561 type:complete len:860 (-) Transcript_21823:2639-5218(-)